MRVLLDASAVPESPVGAGVYVLRLTEALAARPEVELHLLTRRSDADRWRDQGEVHALVPERRPTRLAWEQVAAARLVDRVRPDVWHGPHYTLPLRVSVPRVVTIHDCTFFDHPEWHERSKVVFFRRMIRASVRHARVIVCVSHHTADRVRALLHPSAPVVVAPHGVDHDRFRPEGDAPADEDLLRSVGASAPFLAYAGLLEPRKDIPTLIDAFAKLAATRPDLRLVLAGGDGWGADAVRDAVRNSGVATAIVRPGYVRDDVLPALFRRAAAVAYPSLDEGFGLPVLEALACGAPVVTTAGTAMEEVAGDAAELVLPGDASALAAGLARVLDDTDRARELRIRGPKRAREFTWAASAQTHLDAYRAAIGSAS